MTYMDDDLIDLGSDPYTWPQLHRTGGQTAPYVVPSWTLADFQAALRQGWIVAATGVNDTDNRRIEGVDATKAYAGVAGAEVPLLNNDNDAIKVVRDAVKRGEVHALKAWAYLLEVSPQTSGQYALAEWELPE